MSWGVVAIKEGEEMGKKKSNNSGYYCNGQALRKCLEEKGISARKIGPMLGHGETYLYSFFAKNKMTDEIADILQTEFEIDINSFCSKKIERNKNITVSKVNKPNDSLEEKIYRAVLRALKEVIG